RFTLNGVDPVYGRLHVGVGLNGDLVALGSFVDLLPEPLQVRGYVNLHRLAHTRELCFKLLVKAVQGGDDINSRPTCGVRGQRCLPLPSWCFLRTLRETQT